MAQKVQFDEIDDGLISFQSYYDSLIDLMIVFRRHILSSDKNKSTEKLLKILRNQLSYKNSLNESSFMEFFQNI